MTLEKWIVRPGEQRVIDLGIVRSLKVALAGGQINLVGHDEETARIEVHEVHGKDLKIEINGDRLDIDHPQVAWNNFLEVFRNFGANSAKATISLLVPRAVALTFGTVTAGALVTGLTSDAKLSTVSGELQLDGITGNIDVHSVSGEVSIQNHTGRVDVQTVSGDITATGHIERFSADGITADTFLDIRGHVDKISSNTVSGALTARIDPGLGARYVANTVTGALRLDGNVITSTRGRGYNTTTIGADDSFYVDIAANSVSGDISVLRRDRDDVGHTPSAASASAQATSTPSSSAPGSSGSDRPAEPFAPSAPASPAE